MPVKHNLFVSVCTHLIYATLKSTSVVSSLNFATLCHLGHYLTYDLSDDEDIVFRSRDFLKKANLLFYNFKFCSPSTLTFLLHSFCLSLYGCALWHLDSKAITSIEVAFNKVLRRIGIFLSILIQELFTALLASLVYLF